MLGTALVSAAALAIFAVVQNSQEVPTPTTPQAPSYALTFFSCATILAAGVAGILLSSNTLIISALAAAVLAVIQSDVALHHLFDHAGKSLNKAKEHLDVARTDIDEVTENQEQLAALIAYFQKEQDVNFRSLQKLIEEYKAAKEKTLS